MFAERVNQSVGPPKKHSTVPEIIARSQKLRRIRQVGLLGKASNTKRAARIRRAGFNISITSFRTRGANTEHDNILSSSCDLNALAKRLAIPFRIANHMV